MIRDFILKQLGIDEKISEAHTIKNVATKNLLYLERERQKIKRAVDEIKQSVDRQEQIINDTASNIGVSLILARDEDRKNKRK